MKNRVSVVANPCGEFIRFLGGGDLREHDAALARPHRHRVEGAEVVLGVMAAAKRLPINCERGAFPCVSRLLGGRPLRGNPFRKEKRNPSPPWRNLAYLAQSLQECALALGSMIG